MPMRTLRRTAGLVLALVLTACGGEEADDATAAVEEIPVEAFEYEFVLRLERPLSPVSYEAGPATFVLENIGEEEHELLVMRLDEDRTLADVLSYIEEEASQSGPPDWVTIEGSTSAGPGDTSEPVAVELSGGQYVLMCFTPTEEGVPHVALGMMKAFTVE
jgi:hypothetical protein